MEVDLFEWTNLLLRWVHIFAGILWIGSTWYFTWLDARMHKEGGVVWMVHSGGFYSVEKQKQLELKPRPLHWFRYEALFTWISGVLLLIVSYYLGGLVMVDESPLSPGMTHGIAFGGIILAWLVYDLIWISPISRVPALGVALCYALAVGATYGFTKLMSARAAYMHVGAMLGTLMVANVWMRILPSQRAMLAAVKAGKQADMTLGERAKARSTHNTYMILPVLLIMISNHFPTATFGSDWGWAVLAVLMLVGGAAAGLLRRSYSLG